MSGAQRTRIKFCGMTSAADIALAVEAGADAIGVILAPSSPRRVELAACPLLAAAIPPFVTKVAVVTSPTRGDAERLRALGFLLQFSGDESPAECEQRAAGSTYLKVFHLGARRTCPMGDDGRIGRQAERNGFDEVESLGDDPPDAVADPNRFNQAGTLAEYTTAIPMFDSRVGGKHGGTGKTFAWDIVAPLARRRPIIISGGLHPANVAACVQQLHPYAVDVRSGIESNGRKDAHKMRAFARAVMEVDGR
ncbi:MAG: phosphoribosylanthranilate isomerase [Candidatus Eremiobacteraeota bacterium]|nr:phosphoribosylanthranilate isomerase [Candidatus Eremiobacteraeota bacterium]